MKKEQETILRDVYDYFLENYFDSENISLSENELHCFNFILIAEKNSFLLRVNADSDPFFMAIATQVLIRIIDKKYGYSLFITDKFVYEERDNKTYIKTCGSDLVSE